MENVLPKGWASSKLGYLGQYLNGRAFKPNEWKLEGLPIVRIQNLNNEDAPFNYTDKIHEQRYLIDNNTLLMAWSASLGVYFWDKGPAWLNQHIFKVLPNEKLITKRFLYYCLSISIDDFYRKTHGTGMVHITKPVFENHEIPLPPLSEQERIVAKLDKLFAQHEKIKKALDRIPLLLKTFRQQLLTHAVTGKLTEQWRKGRSLDVKFGLTNTGFRTWKFSAPSRWKVVAFGDVAEVKSNLVDPNNFSDYFLIAPDNIEANTGKLINTPLVSEVNPKSGKHLFNKGVIIYSKIRPYLSKLIIADFYGLCSADMYPIDNTVHTEIKYIYYYMLSNEFLSYSTTAGERSVLPKINQKGLNEIPFPLPALEEQKEIVSRVESLFFKADAIETRYQTLKAKIDNLPQAILHKAFKGELVPQLTTDGDAMELLAEIMALKKDVKKKGKA